MEREPVIRLPGQGRAVFLAGDVNRFVATGRDTNGAYAQWVVVVPPGGGPRPHIHTREEESVHVLEGEVTLQVGEVRTVAPTGATACLPVGVPHFFRNETDRPARLLFTVAPAGLEEFFFEAGVEAPADAADAPPVTPEEIGRILAAAPKYGITIVPPDHGEKHA